jgi:hypothetical protein
MIPRDVCLMTPAKKNGGYDLIQDWAVLLEVNFIGKMYPVNETYQFTKLVHDFGMPRMNFANLGMNQ